MSISAFDAGAGVLGAAIAFHAFYRRYCLFKLRWPHEIGFYDMEKRVRKYFLYSGWHLRFHVNSALTSSPAEYNFVVSKGETEFFVKCYPSAMSSYATSIKDFDTLRIESWSKDRGFIFVTADEPPPHVVSDALKIDVFVLRYSKLDRLCALDLPDIGRVRSFVADQRAEV